MSRDGLKRMLVGTTAGRLVAGARDCFEIGRSVIRNPESVGTLINDSLSLNFISQLCDHDRTFLDVGAHIGSVMAEVRRHNSQTKIVGIEAIPEKARWLSKKFPLSTIHCCAVGAIEGKATFFINHEHSGYSSLVKPTEADPHVSEIVVPVRTLDTLIPESIVGAMKIDIEGAELEALIGGTRIIRRDRPIIMFESAPSNGHDQGSDKDALWEWFTNEGYELLIPNRLAHYGPPLAKLSFRESHWHPRRTTNYFAIPAEQRDDIRIRAYAIRTK